MINDAFTKRFGELEKSFNQLPFVTNGSQQCVMNGVWHQWGTSAQNLIRAVFGEASPHYKNFTSLYTHCSGSKSQLGGLHAVFQGAKDDFMGGYVFNVELRVSGEVFGDFIALAQQALSEGHKDVAAVLACAALEDVLKRFAIANDLTVTDKSMQDVVNTLKASGLVSGAQKTLLDAMPRIRNYALHAEWAKLSEPDVNSVIGFVHQFLLAKFSG